MGFATLPMQRNRFVQIARLLGLCLLLVASLMQPLLAWDGLPLIVEHLDQEAGLPQSQVRALAQDELGFLWIGTQEGLARYDGYHFEVFRHQEDNPYSISDNIINAIAPDGKGGLWLATFGGLSYFDATTLSARSWRANPSQPNSLPEDQVRKLFLDESGMLWLVLAKGLCSFDGSYFKKIELPHSSVLGQEFRIQAICGNSRKLWLASSEGLFSFDPTRSIFTHHPFPADRANNPAAANCLYQDSQDRLWLGGSYGLRLYEQNHQTWQAFKSGPGQVPTGRVNTLIEDGENRLWLGTEKGVFCLRPGSDHLMATPIRLPGNKTDENYVISALADQTGCIWFGTYGSGVLRANLRGLGFGSQQHDPDQPSSLSGNQISCVYEDNHGCFWVGTLGSGLNYQAPHGSGFEHDLGIGPSDTVFCLLDQGDQLWFGVNLRLYRHRQEEGQRLIQVGVPFNSEVCQLADAGTNRLWVGTYGAGVYLYETEQQTILTQITTGTIPEYSLSNKTVLSLEALRNGQLWVGTLQGLNLIQPDGSVSRQGQAPARQGGLTHQTVVDLLPDGTSLWLATNGGGINHFNPDSGKVDLVYTTKNGLAGDFVMAMVLDAWGHLWASTTDGLTRINLETQTLVSYDVHDGLSNNEFVGGAAYRNKQGKLYFGSSDGLVFLDPPKPNGDRIPPPPVLTQLQISNRPVLPQVLEPESPLLQSIAYCKSLVLADRHKVFTLEFATLDFTRPDKNRYAYMLEGFDSTWAYSDSQRRFATYTNLDPGNYTFKVKGTNPDGIWNEQSHDLKLLVKPHPLNSALAKLVYLLIATAIAWGYLRLQRIALKSARQVAAQDRAMAETEREHNVRLEKEVVVRTQQLMETEKMLMRQEKLASLGTLAAGVAHEIRNPLNFVNNFADVIQGYIQETKEILEQMPERNKQWIEITELLLDMQESARGIHRHGTRAERIVEDMLGFAQGRKAEFQAVALNEVVREFADLSFQSMRNRFEGERLELEYRLDNAVGTYLIDRQGMSRVVLNLVNNAIEAAQSRTLKESNHRSKVLISTGKTTHYIWVKVCDNGMGIGPEHRDQVFRPFFTTKPGEKHNIGLGLAISYDIVVSQHGGQLTFQSEPGLYTEFTMLLPIKPMAQVTTPRHRGAQPA